jgi:hypothetical protein
MKFKNGKSNAICMLETNRAQGLGMQYNIIHSLLILAIILHCIRVRMVRILDESRLSLINMRFVIFAG